MKKALSFILSLVFLFSIAATPLSVSAELGPAEQCSGPIHDKVYGETANQIPLPEIQNAEIGEDSLPSSNKPKGYTYYVTTAQYNTLSSLIETAIKSHKTTINLSGYNIPYRTSDYSNNSFDLLDSLIFDNPEYFDVVTYWIWYAGDYISKIEIEYALSLDTYLDQLSACEQIADYLISDLIDSDITMDMKALIVHDRLALWNEYDYDSLDDPNRNTASPSQTMYGALVLQTSVCEGYAMAYGYMLDKLGIRNYLCESDELNHVWNILQFNFIGLGECSFHVDVTWDDAGSDKGVVYHDNFMRSTYDFHYELDHDAFDYDRTPSTTYYDDFFWQHSNSAFVHLNNKTFFITDEIEYTGNETWGQALYYYDIEDEISYNLVDLNSQFKWPASGSSHYYNIFSTLDTDGEYVYFSSPTKIYRLNPDTFNYGVAFTPSINGLYIRGFDMDHEKLYISAYNYSSFVSEYVNYGFTSLPEDPTLVWRDGAWRYVKGGAINTTDTTLVNQNGTWYYVKKGLIDYSRAAVNYKNIWYFADHGKVDFTANTLVKNNGIWYYVNKGRIDFGYTGLAKYEGAWYYVKNGRVDFSYTGLVKYSGIWYYVKDGKKNDSYAGLVKHSGAWYYVKGGKLQSSYTGLVKYSGIWYYVKDGKKNDSYVGLVKHSGSWYYVKSGKMQSGYTGLVSHSGAKYYVKAGKMQSSYTGYVTISGKRYYIKNGKIS